MTPEKISQHLRADEITLLPTLVESQRAYFQKGETRRVDKRLEVLARLQTYLESHKDELLQALSDDLGKPAMEAFLSEYYFLLQELKLVRKSLKKWLKPQRVKTPIYFQPCKSEIVLDPFGVVLIVSPWNYPIQLALSPMIAAIAAGNTVVLKPSEVSTASERFLVDLVKACFEPELVAVVTGDVQVAKAVLEVRYDFVFYTGSTEVGRIVGEKAAKDLTPSVLELGGKCPCVIDQDVDLDLAAYRILAGKFLNAGQTCFAPDFVAVHRDSKAAFIKACEQVFEKTPWDKEMTSIINAQHYQRLANLSSGAEIKKGEDDESKNFMAARILPDVQWDDTIMQSEVFGPLLPVVTYTDSNELITKLRNYESPLALYIFSENDSWVKTMISNLPSGGVCINDTMKQGINLDLPFGGVGESGHGRYRGKAGILAMTHQRAVVKRSKLSPSWFDLMPPYEKAYQQISKWMK